MKFESVVLFFVFSVCFEIKGLLGVKTTFQIIPSVVRRGEHAVLSCYYDLQGALLYTVKWYRGIHEIYRFAPLDTPKLKDFPIPGIHVDLSLSNETQVVLRKLEFNMAGNYSCEVSAEAPSFATSTMTGHLDVFAPPESGPVIYVDRPHYGPGEVLKANCTAPPSRPALNLTILVNNQLMSGATKIFNNLEGGFQRSISMISLPLSQLHFRGGKMVVRCIAQLHPVYLDSATLTLPLASDPKSERIMSTSAGAVISASGHQILVMLFFVLFVLNAAMGMDYEEIDGFSDYDQLFSSDYISDATSDQMVASLM